VCLDARAAYDFLGSPEGELAIAHACLYLATAPKSNAAYVAEKAAKRLAIGTGSLPPPPHILNAPTRLMQELGHGKGYEYDHDAPDGFSGQHYWPEGVAPAVLYTPSPRGMEARIAERLAEWARRRAARRDV
jgi:putative ATPase